MKKFSIIEPPSKEFIKIALREFGLKLEDIKNGLHPKEDFLLVSEKYPIFVVADGVTLIQYLVERKEYPNLSPAGEIARVFCEEFLKAAEDKYELFHESDIREIFQIANQAAGKYNQEHGRTKETVDYWNNDFYAATAAFAVIIDKKVYWGSIGDSYIMHFKNDGSLFFKSPDINAKVEAEAPPYVGDANDVKAKAQYVWSQKRNGVNDEGKLIGYGVVTGEEAANRYLNFGSFEVEPGDLVAVITDGFEEYMELPEFLSILSQWPHDMEECFKKFTARKATVDAPEKYGHERSLIVVSI
ncbi:MAG: protein phosphatase 2C domain-containing protein [Patescibacteria group bacterium]|nr:protein phosphatase 2C domain-containing protein [Patescibacteria group bacterium]